jgi:hypothetical protein
VGCERITLQQGALQVGDIFDNSVLNLVGSLLIDRNAMDHNLNGKIRGNAIDWLIGQTTTPVHRATASS